jgi:hypothetical protein
MASPRLARHESGEFTTRFVSLLVTSLYPLTRRLLYLLDLGGQIASLIKPGNSLYICTMICDFLIVRLAYSFSIVAWVTA